jgi:hypothetical protein
MRTIDAVVAPTTFYSANSSDMLNVQESIFTTSKNNKEYLCWSECDQMLDARVSVSFLRMESRCKYFQLVLGEGRLDEIMRTSEPNILGRYLRHVIDHARRDTGHFATLIPPTPESCSSLALACLEVVTSATSAAEASWTDVPFVTAGVLTNRELGDAVDDLCRAHLKFHELLQQMRGSFPSHLLYHVKTSDGGAGVSLSEGIVSMREHVWMLVTDTKAITHNTNAGRDSLFQPAEQGVGAVKRASGTTCPDDDYSGHCSFQVCKNKRARKNKLREKRKDVQICVLVCLCSRISPPTTCTSR